MFHGLLQGIIVLRAIASFYLELPFPLLLTKVTARYGQYTTGDITGLVGSKE